MKHSGNALLMSVAAAALTVGMGVAFAQAPAAQQSAPAEKQQSAPAEKIAPTLEPSKGKAPDAGMKAGKVDENKGGMKPKATSSETKAPETPRAGKTSSDMKTDTKAKTDVKVDTKSSDKAGGTKSSDSKSSAKPGVAGTETKTETKPATTGQGAAAGSAKLSTEQRSTIRTALQKQNAHPVSKVNFSISVGTRVPRSVRFYRVPMQFVEIYPSWRGYDYFLVGDQIIVVHPRTHQIVAVLDA